MQLVFDLGVLNKDDHEIGVAESLKLSALYITIREATLSRRPAPAATPAPGAGDPAGGITPRP